MSTTPATWIGHDCRDLATAVQRTVATGVRRRTGLEPVVRATISEVLLS